MQVSLKWQHHLVGGNKSSKNEAKLFLITTSKNELIDDKSSHVVATSSWRYNNDNYDGSYKPSGIVVLLLCKLDANRGRKGGPYVIQYVDTIHQSKTNIIKGSSSHFGSEVKYYSYGNKGNYRMINGSLVGQYANKKFVKAISSEKCIFNAKLMEELAAQEIATCNDILCKVIPNFKMLLAPVITTGFNLQQKR